MFFIWSRFGFLVPILIFIGLCIGIFVAPTNTGVGFIIAAALLWFSGKKLNKPSGEVYINETTNERVTIERKSTLFFIQIQYYAIPTLLLGLLLAFR